MSKPPYLWKATAAGSAALLIVTAFETIKTISLTHLTQWDSHIITILFCGTLVFILSAIFLRRELVKLNASISFSDLLMDSLPGVVCLFDASGVIRRWNTNFLGYSEAEMTGAKIEGTIAPRSLDAVRQAMKNSLDNGSAETEAWLFAKSGATIPCYLTGVRILYENEPCVVGIAIDISQRKRAEEQIRLQSAALESAGNAVVITDVRGTIQWLNPAFTKLTGYPLEEAVGHNLRILKSGQQRESFYKDLWNTILAGKVWNGEITNRKKDGQLYTEEMTIASVRSDTGQITNFIAIKQDITERKRAEGELKKAKEGADAANRAKSEFLANLSHEIRTPMNGIIGMTDLVLETELSLEQAEYLQMVKGSADALLTLLNDILDFSKMEAGKLELDYLSFNLRKSLGNVVKTLAIKAHQKGLEFIFDVPPEVPTSVFGDPARLRQVLVNLVGNSIKFTEEGEIEVNVRTESQSVEGTILRFSVRDTGIGIPLDRQKEIFDAFSQADSSTTRKYGGTGLGLTITAELVGLMGGRIWVESERGKGSTFYFTIQVGPEVAEVPHEPFDASLLAGVPILVVDDNPTNRRLLEDSVIRWKMIPTVVDGALAAIQVLQHASASKARLPLVLTDAHMPEIDGFGLVEQIRQDPLLSNIRIVLLTSGGERGDAARCQKLGVAAYLKKPFDRLELREVLLRVLAEDRAMPEKKTLVTRHTIREQTKNLSFLVAEDNEVNRKLITRLLEKRGHSVVSAQNGREALETLEKQPFDMVLMDGQMPEMDGFEATKCIREQEKKSGNHLPIIALTALAMQGDVERCLACGMDGYVSKPVKLEKLFLVIENVLAGIRRGSDSGSPSQRAEELAIDQPPLPTK